MDAAKLAYMANQIARNFDAIGNDDAVLATADHIVTFWDPRMKATILTADRALLSPVAAAAIARMAEGGKPASQTPATRFNAADGTGHSDGA